MSLYSDYIKDRGDLEILETEDGFATYSISGQECYIVDIYVIPEKRQKKLASQFADQIAEIGKSKGCKYLTGSVNLSIKNPTHSMKVLLAYGFKFLKNTNSMLYFYKEL